MKNQVGIVVAWVLAVMVGGCALDSTEDVASTADPSQPEVAVTEQHLADQCGHSICETGPAVASNCDSCVVNICAADPFCCTNSWDGLCVGEVSSICHLGPVALTSSTVVSSINVRMMTGHDDLRDGSQALGAFQISSGVLPSVPLNGGAGFPSNTIHNGTIPLSPARTLGSLTGFTLTWDGAARRFPDGYDNWNADQFLFFITPGGPGRCPNFLGASIFPGLMTGTRTTFSAGIHFP